MSFVKGQEHQNPIDNGDDLLRPQKSPPPEKPPDAKVTLDNWLGIGFLLVVTPIILKLIVPELFTWDSLKILVFVILLILISDWLWPYGEHGP